MREKVSDLTNVERISMKVGECVNYFVDKQD